MKPFPQNTWLHFTNVIMEKKLHVIVTESSMRAGNWQYSLSASSNFTLVWLLLTLKLMTFLTSFQNCCQLPTVQYTLYFPFLFDLQLTTEMLLKTLKRLGDIASPFLPNSVKLSISKTADHSTYMYTALIGGSSVLASYC